jgi:hypothetical protein
MVIAHEKLKHLCSSSPLESDEQSKENHSIVKANEQYLYK